MHSTYLLHDTSYITIWQVVLKFKFQDGVNLMWHWPEFEIVTSEMNAACLKYIIVSICFKWLVCYEEDSSIYANIVCTCISWRLSIGWSNCLIATNRVMMNIELMVWCSLYNMAVQISNGNKQYVSTLNIIGLRSNYVYSWRSTWRIYLIYTSALTFVRLDLTLAYLYWPVSTLAIHC